MASVPFASFQSLLVILGMSLLGHERADAGLKVCGLDKDGGPQVGREIWSYVCYQLFELNFFVCLFGPLISKSESLSRKQR